MSAGTQPGAARRSRIGQVAIDITPLRESPDYRRLFAGRFLANSGNVIAVTAASWQIFGLTHSSLAVGLLTASDSAGMLVGLLSGGMLADRHDRQRVLMIVRLPQAPLPVLLLINSLPHRPALWPIYVITLFIGLTTGLGNPAMTAAIPALVGSDRLATATALHAMANQIGNLAGPAIAGLLIAESGVTICYGLDAAGFLAFGLVLTRVRPLPPVTRGQQPGLRSLMEGFRYVRHHRVVAALLLVDANAMIFGMPAGLFPALATEHFHGGSATFGLLAAAPGLGALTGALTSGWTARTARPGLIVVGAGIVWGAAIVGFGLSTYLPIALAFLVIAGMGDLVSEVLRGALLQRYTPDQLRGRVSSLFLAQVNSAPALGNVEAGAIAQVFSPIISVVSGGIACVAGAIVLGALMPSLRASTLVDQQTALNGDSDS
jgi:MFS transporter, ENTS family, enterobactin (siderophore) exporter